MRTWRLPNELRAVVVVAMVLPTTSCLCGLECWQDKQPETIPAREVRRSYYGGDIDIEKIDAAQAKYGDSDSARLAAAVRELTPRQRRDLKYWIQEAADEYYEQQYAIVSSRYWAEVLKRPQPVHTGLEDFGKGFGQALADLIDRTPEGIERARQREEARRREAERRRELAAREEQERQARGPDPTPARNERRQATAGSADGSGCADGPICTRAARNGEDMVATIRAVIDSGVLDITNNSLAAALATRGSIACIRVCLDMEETRSECRQGLGGAIRELETTYESALTAARQASVDDRYVDSFDRDPQGSEFVRRYFGDAGGLGHVDTCGATTW